MVLKLDTSMGYDRIEWSFFGSYHVQDEVWLKVGLLDH